MTAVSTIEVSAPHTPAPDAPGTPAEAWRAVRARDHRFDGRFVYAVRTTGVYCRPSCGARRPRRANVRFFPDPAAAEAAGFRPCRRCRPAGGAGEDTNAGAVRRAREELERRVAAPPTLAELGALVGMSPWHLQRVFKRAVGLTPREYVAARRAERLRNELRESRTVSRAVYAAGYGSGRPVYERGSPLGMTPAAYRRGGAGLTISYVIVPSPLGRLLVAATDRGVCAVRLGGADAALEAGLRAEFPAADLRRETGPLAGWVAAIVRHLEGQGPRLDVPVDVRATAFQWRVWSALRRIPYGHTRSYADVAREVGAPKAVRAVARACAANPVALVVPCHRVVRSDGALGGYRWGARRKATLLARERAAALRAEGAVLRELVRGIGGAQPREVATAVAPGAIEARRRQARPILAFRYRLLARLGEGATGVVYRARDLELGETVALKLIEPAAQADAAALRQAAREVRLTRRITHPNVVRTHELGRSDGTCFLVMEYVAGLSLAEVIARRGPIPPAAARVLGMQLCRALEVVHARGVLHRDVKPQNLLITPAGELKLADFGTAALRRAQGIGADGAGTPFYMAPEQLLGERVDARADLYGVGVVLWECLTGRVPFAAPTPAALAARILEGPPPPTPPLAEPPPGLPEAGRAIPRPLAELLREALAPDPADRPPSAAALHDRLALLPL